MTERWKKSNQRNQKDTSTLFDQLQSQLDQSHSTQDSENYEFLAIEMAEMVAKYGLYQ